MRGAIQCSKRRSRSRALTWGGAAVDGHRDPRKVGQLDPSQSDKTIRGKMATGNPSQSDLVRDHAFRSRGPPRRRRVHRVRPHHQGRACRGVRSGGQCSAHCSLMPGSASAILKAHRNEWRSTGDALTLEVQRVGAKESSPRTNAPQRVVDGITLSNALSENAGEYGVHYGRRSGLISAAQPPSIVARSPRATSSFGHMSSMSCTASSAFCRSPTPSLARARASRPFRTSVA